MFTKLYCDYAYIHQIFVLVQAAIKEKQAAKEAKKAPAKKTTKKTK